jgi:predicted Holliday junction resolvase-like endonuclease
MEVVGPSVLAGLIVGIVLTVIANSSLWRSRESEFDRRVNEAAEKIAEQKLRASTATLKGQIGERFAPLVKGFGYEPAAARFLGSPIDYVVFDGISDGQIREIAFVEVKVGRLPLTPFQRQVERAVKEGRVTWRVVELPDV